MLDLLPKSRWNGSQDAAQELATFTLHYHSHHPYHHLSNKHTPKISLYDPTPIFYNELELQCRKSYPFLKLYSVRFRKENKSLFYAFPFLKLKAKP